MAEIKGFYLNNDSFSSSGSSAQTPPFPLLNLSDLIENCETFEIKDDAEYYTPQGSFLQIFNQYIFLAISSNMSLLVEEDGSINGCPSGSPVLSFDFKFTNIKKDLDIKKYYGINLNWDKYGNYDPRDLSDTKFNYNLIDNSTIQFNSHTYFLNNIIGAPLALTDENILNSKIFAANNKIIPFVTIVFKSETQENNIDNLPEIFKAGDTVILTFYFGAVSYLTEVDNLMRKATEEDEAKQNSITNKYYFYYTTEE